MAGQQESNGLFFRGKNDIIIKRVPKDTQQRISEKTNHGGCHRFDTRHEPTISKAKLLD